MVKAIREAELAIGELDYNLTSKQLKGKEFSISLYVGEDIKVGELLTKNNLKLIRPGFVLHPKYHNTILGEVSNNDIEKVTRFSLEFIKK